MADGRKKEWSGGSERGINDIQFKWISLSSNGARTSNKTGQTVALGRIAA